MTASPKKALRDGVSFFLYFSLESQTLAILPEISKICKEIEGFINDENQGFCINPGQDSFAKAVEFGASSIDLEILCYTNKDSYTEYSEVKQNLLLKIKSIVIENNSDFAFPSRSIYFENNLEK